MYKVAVEWLDQEKSRARFALPGRVEWSAEHVTALIHLLAEIREQMSPAISADPPPLHAEVLHDPLYSTQLHQFSGGTLLEFRHPSLGWMDFVLPSRERVRISRLLIEQEETWQRYRR